MGLNVEYLGHLNIYPEVSLRTARQIEELGPDSPGAPDSNCDFEIAGTGNQLVHNGAEKTHDDAEWIKYIYSRILKPRGHEVDGVFRCTTETGDRYNIFVTDGRVVVSEFTVEGDKVQIKDTVI